MYTLKCTYSVGAVPEGLMQASSGVVYRRSPKAEVRQSAKRRQNRPTNIELAFYIFNVSRTDTVSSYM